jgi:hypothetical protein
VKQLAALENTTARVAAADSETEATETKTTDEEKAATVTSAAPPSAPARKQNRSSSSVDSSSSAVAKKDEATTGGKKQKKLKEKKLFGRDTSTGSETETSTKAKAAAGGDPTLAAAFKQMLDERRRMRRLRQAGLEKTRVFLKKTSPVGFLGFFGFFGVFLPRREGFRVFFSFKNTFSCIQTLNYNHSY